MKKQMLAPGFTVVPKADQPKHRPKPGRCRQLVAKGQGCDAPVVGPYSFFCAVHDHYHPAPALGGPLDGWMIRHTPSGGETLLVGGMVDGTPVLLGWEKPAGIAVLGHYAFGYTVDGAHVWAKWEWLVGAPGHAPRDPLGPIPAQPPSWWTTPTDTETPEAETDGDPD